MFVCSVILYDPNVRDYIHTYTSRTRFRLERFRCRSTSREARGDDDAIDRTIDSSMVERSRMDDDDDVLVASSSSSCFERLGLGDATTRTTTREHVRRAFRRLVIDAHPDRRNGCSRAYHALVRLVSVAHERVIRPRAPVPSIRVRGDDQSTKRSSDILPRRRRVVQSESFETRRRGGGDDDVIIVVVHTRPFHHRSTNRSFVQSRRHRAPTPRSRRRRKRSRRTRARDASVCLYVCI